MRVSAIALAVVTLAALPALPEGALPARINRYGRRRLVAHEHRLQRM